MKRPFTIPALLVMLSATAWANGSRPNILFIMSDDHTTQAVGAYGSRLATLNPTPTIDTLARDGVVMSNVTCVNSICTPSRACIMTGQYPHINGVLDLGGRLPAERQYLAIEMKKAGYETAVIGKWHLKERPDAFDYYKVLPGQGLYLDPEFHEMGKPDKVRMKGHSSDCITDLALAWLQSREGDQPFFLKLHYKAPHDMFRYAPRYEDYLADVQIPEPESLYESGNHGSLATRGDRDELRRYIGTSVGRRNLRRNYARHYKIPEEVSDREAKHLAYQTYLKHYLRCVKGVDDNVKRVFDLLREQGLYDDTLIIYTGDQGMWLGEHDYQDKRWGYEESLKMPFLVRYPKTIAAGSRSDAVVENVDFAPMMLDFAGVPTPAYMQGRSFRTILETGIEPDGWKDEAYYQYWMHMVHHDNPGHIALRTKRYKIILFYGMTTVADKNYPQSRVQTPAAWELYDLRKDPREMNNVYDNPEYAGVVSDMKQRLAALRNRISLDDPSTGQNHRVRREMAAVNAVIDRYWVYDDAARAEAIQNSHAVLEQLRELNSKRIPRN